MAILSFPIANVQKLYDHIMDPKHSPSPTLEDLFNPDYYPGGKVIEKNDWPDQSKLDRSKLPRSFHLVHDSGVYLMAGVKETLSGENDKDVNFVVYAKGMNCHTDDDYYETSRFIVGDDDFALSIPAEWFEIAKRKPTARTFRINFGARSISLAK